MSYLVLQESDLRVWEVMLAGTVMPADGQSRYQHVILAVRVNLSSVLLLNEKVDM